MKKRITFILLALLLILAWIPLQLFVIGEPVDGEQLSWEVQAEEDILCIHISTPASAVALRGLKVRQDGSTCHISLRKVLVSHLFSSGSASVEIDILKIDRVFLGGKLVWSSE